VSARTSSTKEVISAGVGPDGCQKPGTQDHVHCDREEAVCHEVIPVLQAGYLRHVDRVVFDLVGVGVGRCYGCKRDPKKVRCIFRYSLTL